MKVCARSLRSRSWFEDEKSKPFVEAVRVFVDSGLDELGDNYLLYSNFAF